MTDIDLSPEAVERLCEMLVQVNKTRHGYSGHPRFNRDGLQAAATLRALSARVEELEAVVSAAKKLRARFDTNMRGRTWAMADIIATKEFDHAIDAQEGGE